MLSISVYDFYSATKISYTLYEEKRRKNIYNLYIIFFISIKIWLIA